MNLKKDEIAKLDSGKYYENIINSNSYLEFELQKENDDLSNKINNLHQQLNLKAKENVVLSNSITNLNLKTKEIAEYLTAYGYLKYKSKNIGVRIKNRIRSPSLN